MANRGSCFITGASSGLGEGLALRLAEEGYTGVRVVRLGISDQFVEHGAQRLQRSGCGIDTPAIVEAARAMVTGNSVDQAAS